MPFITFSATFTDEQIDSFAAANGYQPRINNEANPVTALQFCSALARKNMVDYLVLPELHAIVAQKNQEQAEAIEALKASVNATIAVEIE